MEEFDVLLRYYNYWDLVTLCLIMNFLPVMFPERGKYLRKAFGFQWEQLRQQWFSFWYRFPFKPLSKLEEKTALQNTWLAVGEAIKFQLIGFGLYFVTIVILGLIF